MNKLWWFSFLLIAKSSIFCLDTSKNLMVLSIPKSGTHLLLKCCDLLKMEKQDFPYKIEESHPGFIGLGGPDPSICLDRIKNNPQWKMILNIRDLRDCYCSAVPYLDKVCKLNIPIHKQFTLLWEQLENDSQKLKYLLQLDHPMPWDLTLTFKEAVRLMDNPNIFVTRFEDLIGEDKEAQRDLLKKLINYLELEYSDESLTFIQNALFGPELVRSGELFFNEGKTGKWKTMFNEEHKQIFKERAGEELIFFGYEKDNDW